MKRFAFPVVVAVVVGLAVGAAVTWPVGTIVGVVVALGLLPVARRGDRATPGEAGGPADGGRSRATED